MRSKKKRSILWLPLCRSEMEYPLPIPSRSQIPLQSRPDPKSLPLVRSDRRSPDVRRTSAWKFGEHPMDNQADTQQSSRYTAEFFASYPIGFWTPTSFWQIKLVGRNLGTGWDWAGIWDRPRDTEQKKLGVFELTRVSSAPRANTMSTPRLDSLQRTMSTLWPWIKGWSIFYWNLLKYSAFGVCIHCQRNTTNNATEFKYPPWSERDVNLMVNTPDVNGPQNFNSGFIPPWYRNVEFRILIIFCYFIFNVSFFIIVH